MSIIRALKLSFLKNANFKLRGNLILIQIDQILELIKSFYRLSFWAIDKVAEVFDKNRTELLKSWAFWKRN